MKPSRRTWIRAQTEVTRGMCHRSELQKDIPGVAIIPHCCSLRTLENKEQKCTDGDRNPSRPLAIRIQDCSCFEPSVSDIRTILKIAAPTYPKIDVNPMVW